MCLVWAWNSNFHLDASLSGAHNKSIGVDGNVDIHWLELIGRNGHFFTCHSRWLRNCLRQQSKALYHFCWEGAHRNGSRRAHKYWHLLWTHSSANDQQWSRGRSPNTCFWTSLEVSTVQFGTPEGSLDFSQRICHARWSFDKAGCSKFLCWISSISNYCARW